MADLRSGSVHAAHDRDLIARVASGDGSSDEVARAARLRVTCVECAELDADIRAITVAVRQLAIADAAVVAPRDFQLSMADAAKARPGGTIKLSTALRLALHRSWSVAGGALVALGIVGILLGSGVLPRSSQFGATGAAPPTERIDTKGPGPGEIILAPAESADATAPNGGTSPDQSSTPSSDGPSPNVTVLVLSGATGAVGLALLLAARRGRRSGP